MFKSRSSNNSQKGALAALGAYGLWGISPLYFKALTGVGALEIAAHRIVWSVLFVGFLLAWRRDLAAFFVRLAEWRVLRVFFITALLIAGNWLLFISGIAQGRVIEIGLGYYINPLVSVALGAVVLKEKLHRAQWFAVLLAACGVIYLAWALGAAPWMGLALAASFALYGLMRKTAPLESIMGLGVETLLLAPLALGYLLWLGQAGAFAQSDWQLDWLLVAAGPVTAVPLLLFAYGARRIPLSLIGFLQYVGPSLQLMLAVFVFGEDFTSAHAIAFALIWAALAIFTASSLRAR